jgi:hypothetical protein
MQRQIDLAAVTRIEYAELPTVADMYLYEIYLINKHKPPLNCDDKAPDELTVVLPSLDFQPFDSPLLDKWRKQIAERDKEESERRQRKRELWEQRPEMRRKWHSGEITEDEYYAFKEMSAQ